MSSHKKQKLREWREKQRAAAREALPLTPTALRALFDMLNVELARQGCDHSRRLTQSWLESEGHDVVTVFTWFEGNGGYCDCEVLANCEQAFEEAMRGA